MNVRSHKLFTSMLAAGALLLGACVAETGDDEEAAAVGSVTAADTYVPMLPKDPGGTPTGTSPNGRAVAKVAGSDNAGTPCADPEPSPWIPGKN